MRPLSVWNFEVYTRKSSGNSKRRVWAGDCLDGSPAPFDPTHPLDPVSRANRSTFDSAPVENIIVRRLLRRQIFETGNGWMPIEPPPMMQARTLSPAVTAPSRAAQLVTRCVQSPANDVRGEGDRSALQAALAD